MALILANPVVDLKPTNYSGLFYLADGAAIFGCIGDPSGQIVANKRSLAISDNGSVYIKTTDGVNTGWTAIGGGGGGINPTSLFLPYNNSGTFSDSPLKRTAVDSVRVNDGTTDYVSLGSGGVQTFFNGSFSFPAFNVNSVGGLYAASGSSLALAIGGGVNRVWNATQELSVANGSAANPAYSFNGFSGAGLWAASGQTSLSVAGVEALRLANGGTGVVGLVGTQGAAGSGFTLGLFGGNANENIILTPKGTGVVAFNGNTSSFPGLLRNATDLWAVLADNSNFCNFKAGTLITNSDVVFPTSGRASWNSDAAITRSSLAVLRVSNNSSGAGGLIIGSSSATGVAGTLTLEPLATPTPVNGSIWSDSSVNAFATRQAGLTENLSGTVFVGTADKTVSNTTTETTILPSGVGTNTIPANFLKPGKTIRLTIRGEFQLTDVVAPSINFRIRRNGTTLNGTGAKTLAANLAGQSWEIVVDIICRSTGAGGTVQLCGRLAYYLDFTTNAAFMVDIGTGAPVTFDTTIAQTIDASVQWGAASANNVLLCQQFNIEVLN